MNQCLSDSRRQSGMALLLVLWAQALLTMLLGVLVVEVRQQIRLGAWQREQLQATLAAEAGVNLAVRALSEPPGERRWIADGRDRILSFEGTRLEISVRSERGKLDLNTAPVADFARLVRLLGASQAQASRLAQALERRRAVDAPPVRALEELRGLPGMDSVLYRAVSGHVTVWSGLESPDGAFATPLLRRALRLPDTQAATADPGPALGIHVRSQRADGLTAELDTTVVLVPGTRSARPYRIVRYNEGGQ